LPNIVFGQQPELVLPIGHTAMVTAAEFSPDGKFVLTGSWDGTAILWNLQGEQLHVYRGGGLINSVAFSPDGQSILTGDYDGQLILWSLRGEQLRVFEGITNVESVDYSPDGQLILVKTWSSAILLNLQGQQLQEFGKNKKAVTSVIFSPDGQFILTGCSDSTAILWNPQGQELRIFRGATSGINSVAFSPDGQSILASCSDSTAILWNLQGQRLRVFPRYSSGISSMTFSPDGQSILTVDGSRSNMDVKFTLLNLRGEPVYSRSFPLSFEERIFNIIDVSAVFSPDGRSILMTGPFDAAVLRDLEGEPIQAFRSYSQIVYSLAVSPDGKRLVGSSGKSAALWSFQGENHRAFHGNKGRILSVAFSPDGEHVLTGSEDQKLVLWNLEGKQIQSFEGHSAEVYSVAFSSDGKNILSGSYNESKGGGEAILWNLQGEQLQVFDLGIKGVGVISVAISPDGQRILTSFQGPNSYGEFQVILWNRQGEQLQVFEDIGQTWSVSFSADGQNLLLCSLDQTIITDLHGHKLSGPTEMKGGFSAVFSPKCPITSKCSIEHEQKVLIGGTDQKASLLNLKGEEIQSFGGQNGYIKSVAFSPVCTQQGTCLDENSQFIFTSSYDNTTKIWNLKTGAQIATLINVGTEDWIITTPSGLFDASAGAMTLMHYVVFYEGKYEVIELEQLKARYYEPGLLAKVTGFSKERIRPIENFDAVALYPAVEAQIRADSLSIELKERNGGIGKVSIFINGKEVVEEVNPLPRRENAKRNSSIRYDLKQHQNYLLQHPDSTNVISIRAYNEEGWLKSRAIHLDYKTPLASSKGTGRSSTQPRSRRNQRPKLYVVSIGTSDYTGEEMDLQYADQDATSMALALQSVGGALFSNGDSLEIHCLTTAKGDSTGLEGSEINWKYADKENIESTFKAIQQKAKAEDVIVVYLSGHGVARSGRDQTQFYYLTQGVASEESLNDPRTLDAYSISTEEFTTWINSIPALKQVLIIDACNSGQLVENITNKAVTLNSSQIRALDRMRDRTGMFLLSGSASDKVSYEASQYGQGLLTYALLQGMRGVAARKDTEGQEVIDVMKLFQYARDEVPRLASSINGIQTPMLGFPSQGASFDIGILDDEVKAKIPIGNEKPIIIRSNFLNELTFEDDLQLVQGLEKAFRKESSKGANAQMIYVDVNDYPGAYALRGLYRVDENQKIKIKLRLFRGKESKVLEIAPVDSAKELVGEMLWEVENAIAEWEKEEKSKNRR